MRKNRGNKRKHIVYEERYLIEKMITMDISLSEISRLLQRGISTVSTEIATNGGRRLYRAKKAQRMSDKRQVKRKKVVNKVSSDHRLRNFVKRHRSLRLSPEAISNMLRTHKHLRYVSPKSIRKFLKK